MDGNEKVMLGEMARLVGGGVVIWHLDRLARANRIPVERVGRYRVCKVSDVTKVRDACAKAGYYRAEEMATA